eukprot:gene2291-2598_t
MALEKISINRKRRERRLIETLQAPSSLTSSSSSSSSSSPSSNAKTLEHEDLEVVRLVIRALKVLSLKDSATNEILRSLDAIHKLEEVLDTFMDAEILNDAATAIECLRRCTPYSTRQVGLGEYNEDSGQFKWMIDMKQLHFKDVGVAWRVWDAGIGYCKWMLENQQLFAGKDVLELGSGLGIAGLCAGLICKSVLMTDYTPKIVRTLKENVKMNAVKIEAIRDSCSVQALDWTKDKVPKPFHYEVIIGTEVIYDVNLVGPLANIIHKSLAPNGVFYGTAATVRRGIPEFQQAMEDLEYEVKVSPFPKRFVPDTHFDILFFECSRKKSLDANEPTTAETEAPTTEVI